MAKQRYINTHFWDDKYIIGLDPIEKLLFIYCLSNPLTNIVGAYEISVRRIAFDTGIDQDMVYKILARFEAAKKMYYRDGWLVIANFIKHQSLNPKIVSGIRNELSNLPEELVELVNFEYEPKDKSIRKKLSASLRKKILERDNYICQFCQSKENLEIDHITPIILGGDDSEKNLRVLCQTCNGKRNAELRWTINGEVENKNSLPTNIGGLSHLNSNTNTNSNFAGGDSVNENDQSPDTDSALFLEFPLKQLYEAFPSIELQPGQIGIIKSTVKDADKSAWLNTIEIYRSNHDPTKNRYLPEKVGNLLNVFKSEKQRAEKNTGIVKKDEKLPTPDEMEKEREKIRQNARNGNGATTKT